MCFVITVVAVFFVGSIGATLFDFRNLNIANMIPVLLIGGFISCVIIAIAVLLVFRSAFLKVKNYFTEENEWEDVK